MYTYYFPDLQSKPFQIIRFFRQVFVRYRPLGNFREMFEVLQTKASAVVINHANAQ